jgi:hypothetical protein
MQKAKEGEVILYVDVDCLFKNDINHLIALAKKHNRVLFENFHANKKYTKRDSFILMGSDNEGSYNQTQLEASYLILINNKENRDFVKKWLEYCEDERILTDIPSTLGKELQEFEDHRHEQAVLSLLASRYSADQVIVTPVERSRYIINYNRKNIIDSLVRLCIFVREIMM